MKIEFVNHSSFIVTHNNQSIICDPWLEGSVFNNGWKLISPTVLGYNEFSRINYIWFSHEHPDHFFPPNIKKIPAEYRKNITVLFQVTKDKRVVNWCKAQGFKDVVEMYPDKWIELDNGIKALCEHYQEGDSWICFKTPEQSILNTNDCGIRDLKDCEKIRDKVGPVDILLTQFSYAYWAGNPDETEYRKKVAAEKLYWMKFQSDVFKPKVLIPTASYVYFSHIENAYLNDLINTPRKTYDYVLSAGNCKPVILYPGEIYALGDNHDSLKSIEKYETDYDKLKEVSYFEKTETIPLPELENTAAAFIDDLKKNNSFYLKMLLKPTHIYVPDYKKSFDLSLNGFVESNVPETNCDASLTSENLQFCLKFPYGLDTTQINGRLRKPKQGNYTRFYNFFRVNQLKSRGTDPNSLGFMLASAGRKIMLKFGVQYAE